MFLFGVSKNTLALKGGRDESLRQVSYDKRSQPIGTLTGLVY